MGSKGILQFGMKRKPGGKEEHRKDQIWEFWSGKGGREFERMWGFGAITGAPEWFPQDIPGSFPASPAAKQGLIYLL